MDTGDMFCPFCISAKPGYFCLFFWNQAVTVKDLNKIMIRLIKVMRMRLRIGIWIQNVSWKLSRQQCLHGNGS